jgi:hypothetical protein
MSNIRNRSLAAAGVLAVGLFSMKVYAAVCTDVSGTTLFYGRISAYLPASNVLELSGGGPGSGYAFFPWGSGAGYNAWANHHAAASTWTRELSTTGCGTFQYQTIIRWDSTSTSCDFSMPPNSDTRTYYLDTCAGGNGNTFAGGRELKFIELGSAKFYNLHKLDAYVNGTHHGWYNHPCYKVWAAGCTNCC